MRPLLDKNDIILNLQREVRSMQGHKKPADIQAKTTGLRSIKQSFPDGVFPTGAVHEFLSYQPEHAAATNGFIAGLVSKFMQQNTTCLWISTRRTIFPPALKVFGIAPERIIFIDLRKQKEALWAVEEALKCDALSAVIGELGELGFTESRRLQLAVEQSNVTGFIHRLNPRNENPVACMTRWKIKPIASITEDGLPGLGFPRWHVQLLKVRNGKPGDWQVEWSGSDFRHIQKTVYTIPEIQKRKAG